MSLPSTILVTGAASGIGRACASILLDAGQEVVALDLKLSALELALPRRDRLAYAEADISDEQACGAAVADSVARFGKLDALIHWAAYHSTFRWSELNAVEFNRTLAINVTGSFLMAQAAARHMAERGKGAIVLASSTSFISGAVGGSVGSGGPAYVASKAAIVGLVRSLARSLGPSGIRVNAVSPGITETAMTAGYTPERRAASIAQVPMGRLAEPGDIASVGIFLTSEAAKYINGEMIIVNGGAAFG